jgi:hypothetical protein
MKKPQKPRPKRRQSIGGPTGASYAKAGRQPPGQEVRRPLRDAFALIAKVAVGAGAVFGLLLTIFHWLPQISVEPSAAADLVSNPLSGYFKITNEQAYSIEDLSVEVSLRCWKMGRGNDTSPMNKCEPSMHSSGSRWEKHTLGPHESYEISPGERLFVTPGALLYAQLDIFVSFQPWKVPWHIHRPFRFETRRLSDGSIQWFHIPND